MSTTKTIESVADIVAQFLADVKQFGIYTAQDKGASEIHNIDADVEFLRGMSGEDAGKSLVALLDNPELKADDMAGCLLRSLIVCLDEQPEPWWDEMMNVDPRLTEFY